ncbi:MAG: DUF6502 family protein [Pseudomonadota bacterium]
MSTENANVSTEVFATVLRGVLRPLVRALIARGLTAPAFYRLAKQIYVEVADDEFSLDGARQTDSRISVLTGVHRRDVKEFREAAPASEAAVQTKVNAITSVLGRWLASDETTDDAGRPLALTRSGEASFDALVASINKDVRPRTILDEMVRQKLVELDPDGRLHLRAEAFVGPDDIDQKVFFFGENVGDHIAAATDNLLSEKPRFLERAVFYNRLASGSVDEIEAVAREGGGALLNDLNRLAHARQEADVSEDDGDERFRFGIFFYRASEETGADEMSPEQGEDDAQR